VVSPAPTDTAGGNLPILHHRAVGYLLAEVAMKIEACRAFQAVYRVMQAMGVNALDRNHPVEKFLREAAVFPLYDAGNIGMQMRKIWGVMLDKDFDPRAMADSRPMTFSKSMEGVGTEVATEPAAPSRRPRPR